MALVVQRIVLDPVSSEITVFARDDVRGRESHVMRPYASLPTGMRNAITTLTTAVSAGVVTIRLNQLDLEIADRQAEKTELGG